MLSAAAAQARRIGKIMIFKVDHFDSDVDHKSRKGCYAVTVALAPSNISAVMAKLECLG